jgi:uncharacterized membrane protein SirB2
MLDYLAVRQVHVSAVAVSLGLFIWRGARVLRDPHRATPRWLRILPHVVDTLLFVSALWLALQLGAGTRGWLSAKLAGVVLYIVLGTIALKRARSSSIRLATFLAALLTFTYVVSVAVTKSPSGWFT